MSDYCWSQFKGITSLYLHAQLSYIYDNCIYMHNYILYIYTPKLSFSNPHHIPLGFVLEEHEIYRSS